MDDNWTTNDIPNLTGKVIIVTGANSGIGYEAALEVARKGGQTVLACRSMDKAQAALSQIQTQVPNAPVEIMQLDLASQASVHAFAEAFKAKYGRLDLLINNAGIMMVPYGKTEDGFERQFGTNHLGHFALTGLLMDHILATPGARVINVSSIAHRNGIMDFDNLMYEGGKGYTPSDAYGRSKLANLLFTHELQRRLDAVGADVRVTAAHPGVSNTNLASHMMEDRLLFKLVRPLFGLVLQSAAMGALPTLRAALDPQAAGGDYFGPGGFREVRGYPVRVKSTAAAHDVAVARKLWEVSEALTGVKISQLDGAMA